MQWMNSVKGVCVCFSWAPVRRSVCACKSTVACVNPPVEPCSQSSSFWNQAWIIKSFHKVALTIYYMRGNRSSIAHCLHGRYWVKEDAEQYRPLFMPHILYLLWSEWQLRLKTPFTKDSKGLSDEFFISTDSSSYIWVIHLFYLR